MKKTDIHSISNSFQNIRTSFREELHILIEIENLFNHKELKCVLCTLSFYLTM